MKNLNLLAILFLTLFSLTLSSCGKDDDDDVSPNVSLLTGGEWTGSAIYVDGEDLTDRIKEQQGFDWKAYTTTFDRDGSYVETYQGDVVVEGVWEYKNNERVILFDKDTQDEYEVVVSKLDEDEFWYIQDGAELRFRR
ncbi:hypothetical protein [Pontibacter akesuensis]|uniref:Lipocalin-like domain-containing protein n=1 Tax=Pontibacter akesuensis TaxID=388950 RepID=A0A1I7I5Y0_9BACT|nr:hypothetical protein [Pontibacter akesuensis]GHA65309.1 hypothetical protein GCM10007389_17650 [Pontibacter akesuensis]SFU68146.1 hypothetical protein SAMN04487941_1928 [Pontibacter akesuensis]